ncbi:MAG: RWP-RK domain-containing protein [Promethearchaeia archaeon]
MLQLRGIDKKIAALKTELNYSTSGDRDQFLAGLSNLQTEKARLAQGAIRAHHDSESERSRSPSSKGEEDATVVMSTPPPSQGGAADRDSDSDDGSVREAEDLQELARHSAELIGPGITVTQKELRNQFHLPLHTVAKKFGMCTTAFKKLCRRFGIAKWPHRQLRGIDKKIAALKAELNYSSVDKETARRNLVALEEEKARLSRVAVGSASAARRGGAGSKRKQHTPEQDMAKSARTAQYYSDASALDLLAAVAGIGETVSTGRRQLAPLHAASSSGSNSSISTPGLEPLSPATVPRQQHSVSPLISSAPAGAWGAAVGMGARMQSLQSCAEAPAPNGLVGVGGDSLGGLSLNSLRILLHQQQQQASGEAGLLGLGGAHSSLARPASANTTTPQQHRVACVGFWNLPSFVTHQVQ